jgi:hypothetical protein
MLMMVALVIRYQGLPIGRLRAFLGLGKEEVHEIDLGRLKVIFTVHQWQPLVQLDEGGLFFL